MSPRSRGMVPARHSSTRSPVRCIDRPVCTRRHARIVAYARKGGKVLVWGEACRRLSGTIA